MTALFGEFKPVLLKGFCACERPAHTALAESKVQKLSKRMATQTQICPLPGKCPEKSDLYLNAKAHVIFLFVGTKYSSCINDGYNVQNIPLPSALSSLNMKNSNTNMDRLQ